MGTTIDSSSAVTASTEPSSASTAASVERPVDYFALPNSTILYRKHFIITGRWASMTCAQARKLVEAHGGYTSQNPHRNGSLVVVGAKGTRANMNELLRRRARAITEEEFLKMLLPPDAKTASNGQDTLTTSRKRSADLEGPAEPVPKKAKPALDISGSIGEQSRRTEGLL